MFKWINAKDRLPNDRDHIIMVTNSDQIYSGRGRVFNRNLFPKNVKASLVYKGIKLVEGHYTHWMLLPTPPERDQE